MAHYNEAYVFNKAYMQFEDCPISLSELLEVSRDNKVRWALIRHELYYEKIRSEE